jgi:hypothetical protein
MNRFQRILLYTSILLLTACNGAKLPTTPTPLDPTPVIPGYTPAPVVHVNPASISEQELRNFRTDFGGVYIPELAPQCPADPVTGIDCVGNPRGLLQGAIFTPAYRVYTADQRKSIRDAFSSRGYHQFPINVFAETSRWYHGIYPVEQGVSLNDALQELWDAQLYPVCFVLPDGQLSADLSNLDRSLCRIVVPMWEMNGPLPDTGSVNEAIRVTREGFPQALLYVHFTATHAAGGSPEVDWWKWAKGIGVTGILYNDDRSDPAAIVSRVDDFLIRFGGGYHNWPTGIDVVLFETDVYQKFWNGKSEGEGLAFNTQILNETYYKQYCYSELQVTYCGQLSGFGSGGR